MGEGRLVLSVVLIAVWDSVNFLLLDQTLLQIIKKDALLMSSVMSIIYGWVAISFIIVLLTSLVKILFIFERSDELMLFARWLAEVIVYKTFFLIFYVSDN